MTDVQNIAPRDFREMNDTIRPSYIPEDSNTDESSTSRTGYLCASCHHIVNGDWTEVDVAGLLPGYVLESRWGSYFCLLDTDHDRDLAKRASERNNRPLPSFFKAGNEATSGIALDGDISSRLFIHHDRDSLDCNAHEGCHMCAFFVESRNYVIKTASTCGSIHERWDSSFPRGRYLALPLLHYTLLDGRTTPTFLLDFILVEDLNVKTVSRETCQVWLAAGFTRLISENLHAPHVRASIFGGRVIPSEPLAVEQAEPTMRLNPRLKERLDRWRRECRSHGLCRKARMLALRGLSELPTRLIELVPFADEPSENDIIRLHDSSELDPGTQYATLSHCWGQNGVSFKLIQSNVLEFRAGLHKKCLSQVFSDAIDVALTLGLRYLWIDALCIIQDDAADWAIEFKKMASVFSRANINIAATASSDGRQGMFRQRNPLLATPLIFDSSWKGTGVQPGTWTMTRSKSWYYQIESGPLNQRGWVLQELVLAPETLHFTTDQIWWSCQTTRRGEALLDEAWGFTIPNALDQWKMNRWTDVIEIFSQLKLSRTNDRLAAIAGMANAWAARYYWKHQDYLAGIWRPEIHSHLLWATLAPRARDSLAPSWSWASIDGAVKWYTTIRPFVQIAEWCTIRAGLAYGSDDDDGNGDDSGLITTANPTERDKERVEAPFARRIRVTLHSTCCLFPVQIDPQKGRDVSYSEIHLENSIPINIPHANRTQIHNMSLVNKFKGLSVISKPLSIQSLVSKKDVPSAVIFLPDVHRSQPKWRQTEAYFLPMRYCLRDSKTREDLGRMMSVFGLVIEPVNGRPGTFSRIGFIRLIYTRENYSEGRMVKRWKQVVKIPKGRYKKRSVNGMYDIEIV